MQNLYGEEINLAVKKLFTDKDLSNKKVLDLGCANGSNSFFLAERGAEIVAIDKDERMADKFKDNKKTKFISNNIQNFDFKNKYNIVLVLRILHLLKLEEIKEILPKIFNSIEERGILIIEMENNRKAHWVHKQLSNFELLKHVKLIPEFAEGGLARILEL